MCDKVFGGTTTFMRSTTKVGGSPVGFWLKTIFNSVESVRYTPYPVLLAPPLEEKQHFYPVKASFCEDIQQREFWVRIYFKGDRCADATTGHRGRFFNALLISWEIMSSPLISCTDC